VPESVGVASFVSTGELPVTVGTAGADVSKLIGSDADAALVFPAASVKAPVAIESDADPALVADAGVKTNEYCVGETTTNVPSVPPVTITSVKIKLDDASESCTVIVAVSPIFRADREVLSVAVGFT